MLLPCFAVNFGLNFESCLFLSGHLKVIAISPHQFRLVIRFERGTFIPEGGGGGGTLIFSHIRRLGLFFGVQNSEFQY